MHFHLITSKAYSMQYIYCNGGTQENKQPNRLILKSVCPLNSKRHHTEFIVFQVAGVWITIQAQYTFFHMSNKSKIDSILGADVLWKDKNDTNVSVYVDVRFECLCINIISKWVFIQ